ncbi:MAG: RDD family protein [Oceanobacter sp.]
MSDRNYPTASLLRRLAAMSYDGLVLIALYIVSGFVFVGIAAAFNNGEPPGAFPAAVNFSLMFCICFFYYSSSWRRGGQTIGMKAWRIKLVSDESNHVKLTQCMLRTGIGFFSLMLFGLGFWWMLLDKQQRTWHDIASLSHPVHIPKT